MKGISGNVISQHTLSIGLKINSMSDDTKGKCNAGVQITYADPLLAMFCASDLSNHIAVVGGRNHTDSAQLGLQNQGKDKVG